MTVMMGTSRERKGKRNCSPAAKVLVVVVMVVVMVVAAMVAAKGQNRH